MKRYRITTTFEYTGSAEKVMNKTLMIGQNVKKYEKGKIVKQGIMMTCHHCNVDVIITDKEITKIPFEKMIDGHRIYIGKKVISAKCPSVSGYSDKVKRL